MEKFIFILGRDSNLSKQEIFSYLKARSIEYNLLDESEIAIVLDLPSINTKNMIKELGGTQKIAKVIESFNGLYNGKENKIKYAISKYSEECEDLRADLKSYFKSLGVKTTIKKSHKHKQEYLNPSEAQDIIEIIQYNGLVAKTLAVFNPRESKKRDTKKPHTAKTGDISIRLAKILINLAQLDNKKSLIQPLCKRATLVQEAAIMGINTQGIAKNKEDLIICKENIEWIKKQYNPKGKIYLTTIYNSVKRADVIILKHTIRIPLKIRDSEARQIIKDIDAEYTKTITKLKTKANKIILITPTLRSKSKKEWDVSIQDLCNRLSLTAQEPISFDEAQGRTKQIWILEKKV
jgi:hypothetical protein